MTVYEGPIVVTDSKGVEQLIDVTIELDKDKLLDHLLKCYNHAFNVACKKGKSQATKLGGSMIMKARRK